MSLSNKTNTDLTISTTDAPRQTKIVFLGGGNMAEAIFAKLCQQAEFKLEIIQRNPQKAARIAELYQLEVKSQLSRALRVEDILILAIKPQQAKQACLAINEYAQSCTVISVMAGIEINSLQNWLSNPKIIRTMPNIAASIGLGVTAIYFPALIPAATRELVSSIFKQVGIISTVHNEDGINQALAISGSAVAFVYYFMEGLINNAVSQFGLSNSEATAIIKQVMEGSLSLLKANPALSISEQRSRVTSKKGTTERGLLTLAEANFQQIIGRAMQDCYQRGLKLAREFN